MSRARMSVSVVLCALVLGGSVCVAQSVDLSYGPPVGASWAADFAIRIRPPAMKEQAISIGYEFSRGEGGHVPFPVSLHIPQRQVSETVTVGPFDGTMHVDGDGAISRLQSPFLADPDGGAYIRNAGLLFPRLPGGEVVAGDRWSSSSLIYVPQVVISATKGKLPKRIPIESDYTFEGFTEDGGARIGVRAQQGQGLKKLKISLTGSLVFHPDSGRIVAASLEGHLKVKKMLIWFKVPLSMSFTEVEP